LEEAKTLKSPTSIATRTAVTWCGWDEVSIAFEAVALFVSYRKQNACSCFKGGLKVVLQGVTSFEQSKSVGFKHIAG